MRRALVLCVALVACTRAPTVAPLPTSTAGPITWVAVKGDWGSGSDKQRLVTSRMCAVRAQTKFTTVVTTGDNFYTPDGVATEGNFRGPEACLEGVTWRAAWGNHDAQGTATGTVLRAPHWYTWSLAGADFFALDSNQVVNPTQLGWFERHLSRSKARAKIVYFHHPPYTASFHAPDLAVRKTWVPLFERYGVTLVLNGHNHDYEHSVVKGIDYVITGGGGQRVYPCIRRTPELKTCDDVYHFLLVGIARDRIVVRAIRGNGGTLDEFSIAL